MDRIDEEAVLWFAGNNGRSRIAAFQKSSAGVHPQSALRILGIRPMTLVTSLGQQRSDLAFKELQRLFVELRLRLGPNMAKQDRTRSQQPGDGNLREPGWSMRQGQFGQDSVRWCAENGRRRNKVLAMRFQQCATIEYTQPPILRQNLTRIAGDCFRFAAGNENCVQP